MTFRAKHFIGSQLLLSLKISIIQVLFEKFEFRFRSFQLHILISKAIIIDMKHFFDLTTGKLRIDFGYQAIRLPPNVASTKK